MNNIVYAAAVVSVPLANNNDVVYYPPNHYQSVDHHTSPILQKSFVSIQVVMFDVPIISIGLDIGAG